MGDVVLPHPTRVYAELLDWVSVRTGVPLTELTRKDRKNPRALLYRNSVWAAMRVLGYSYPEIAKAATRDHTTIMYGVKDAEQRPGIVKLAKELAGRMVEKYRD